MSTELRSDHDPTSPAPGGESPAPREPATGSSLAMWWSTWRVATRLARRDALRHKGRSLLISVMIAVPVILLTVGLILAGTMDVSGVKALPLTMGSAQALVQPVAPAGSNLTQNVAGTSFTTSGSTYATPDPAKPTSGLDGPTTDAPTADALAATLGATLAPGARLVPVTQSDATYVQGNRFRPITTLGIDGRDAATAGKVTLNTGRWPATPDEAVVTELGRTSGLPATGTITVRSADGSSRTLTVVGSGTGVLTDSAGRVAPADVITLPIGTARAGDDFRPPVLFLLAQAGPVDWAQVRTLNAAGALVTSRAVIEDPQIAYRADPGILKDQIGSVSQAVEVLFTVMATFGLLLLTTLLAGPAFAVSAARQRRTLALAASNGALTKHLRRMAVGPALVLGLGSAVVATLFATGVTTLLLPWMARRWPDTYFGPTDVPLGQLALVVGGASVAALVAALVPTVGLARLDIVGVLRGQSRSPKLRRGVSYIGMAVLALGVAASLTSAWVGDPNAGWIGLVAFGGAVLLVIGALLLVPALLVLIARLSGRASVTIRMATRDAARQRGRATSTIAAILGSVAVLCTLLIAVTSVDAYAEKTYRPAQADGTGIVSAMNWSNAAAATAQVEAITSSIGSIDPGLRSGPIGLIRSGRSGTGSDPVPFVAALRSGCTLNATLGSGSNCVSLGSVDQPGTDIAVADADTAARQLSLTDAQRDALAAGGILVATDPATATDPMQSADQLPVIDTTGGELRIASGMVRTDQSDPATGSVVGDVTEVTLPVIATTHAVLSTGPWTSWSAALVTPETATRLGWPVEMNSVAFWASDGSVSPARAQTLQDALQDRFGEVYLYVERGYQSSLTVFVTVMVLVVALIILVGTLVATALGQAELQPLMGTLAAVGATRGTRRRIAGAQAAVLGLVGSMTGLLVGALPGISLAIATTRTVWVDGQARAIDPTVAIPWLPLLGTAVLVPLVAAAMAWLAVRRAPVVTRRMT